MRRSRGLARRNPVDRVHRGEVVNRHARVVKATAPPTVMSSAYGMLATTWTTKMSRVTLIGDLRIQAIEKPFIEAVGASAGGVDYGILSSTAVSCCRDCAS